MIMKKKELVSMREKNKSELIDIIAQKRKEVTETYGKMKTGREKNLKKGKNLRLDIVQLLGIVETKSKEKEKETSK